MLVDVLAETFSSCALWEQALEQPFFGGTAWVWVGMDSVHALAAPFAPAPGTALRTLVRRRGGRGAVHGKMPDAKRYWCGCGLDVWWT